jgi:hypothetical protein
MEYILGNFFHKLIWSPWLTMVARQNYIHTHLKCRELKFWDKILVLSLGSSLDRLVRI